MTNSQLLITARHAHEDAAVQFFVIAAGNGPGTLAYQAAADKLHQAGIDYAVVAGAIDGQVFYGFTSLAEVSNRLEAWTPTDPDTEEAPRVD